MMRSGYVFSWAALAIIALAQIGASPQTPRGLRSPDFRVRNEAAGRIIADQQAYAADAIAVFAATHGQYGETDPREPALKVIAALRPPEAVRPLLAGVDDRAYVVGIDEGTSDLGETYPALGALVVIGRPAVRGCLWDLTNACPDGRRAKLCWVVAKAEGRDVGRLLVEHEIARHKDDADPTARDNLQLSLALFDKQFPPGKRDP